MTMKVEISREVQAGLLARAQQRGMSLEVFVESVLREQSRSESGSRVAHELSNEERLREFNAWVKSHAGTAPKG